MLVVQHLLSVCVCVPETLCLEVRAQQSATQRCCPAQLVTISPLQFQLLSVVQMGGNICVRYLQGCCHEIVTWVLLKLLNLLYRQENKSCETKYNYKQLQLFFLSWPRSTEYPFVEPFPQSDVTLVVTCTILFTAGFLRLYLLFSMFHRCRGASAQPLECWT